MTNERKQRIVSGIRRTGEAAYKGDNIEASCLFWAKHTASMLAALLGRRAIIQAGSASWPLINDREDDGVRSTHFSYQFELDKNAIGKLMEGKLPELHAWAALPDTNEIIDITTCYGPRQAERMGVIKRRDDWTAPVHDFIWTKADRLPRGVLYHASMQAIAVGLPCSPAGQSPGAENSERR